MATAASLLALVEASLERILATDVSEWEEKDRRAHQLEIKDLFAERDRLKAEVDAGGRRILNPVRRVNI